MFFCVGAQKDWLPSGERGLRTGAALLSLCSRARCGGFIQRAALKAGDPNEWREQCRNGDVAETRVVRQGGCVMGINSVCIVPRYPSGVPRLQVALRR